MLPVSRTLVVEVAVAAGNFWNGCANISFSQNRVLGDSKDRWAINSLNETMIFQDISKSVDKL
jgi:hypothetical protein